MKILETDRLLLRRLSLEDAGFILGLLNEPSYVHFIGDKGVRTINDARDYIMKGPIASYEQHGFGLYLTELKDSEVPIGICGLLKRENLSDVDIGFAFLPQFWSQGYAFEAASAVMAYGRDALMVNRIVAIVSPDNERSIKVLGKLGLRFERMERWPADGSEIKLYASEVKNRVNKMEKIFDGKKTGKLGTDKNPAVVQVQTKKRMKEVAALFEKNGWKYTIGLEPDKPEDITDLEILLNPPKTIVAEKKVGRNDPCPCGSGKKYKKCCGQ